MQAHVEEATVGIAGVAGAVTAPPAPAPPAKTFSLPTAAFAISAGLALCAVPFALLLPRPRPAAMPRP